MTILHAIAQAYAKSFCTKKTSKKVRYTLSERKLQGAKGPGPPEGRLPYRTATKSTLSCFHSMQKGLGLGLGWCSDSGYGSFSPPGNETAKKPGSELAREQIGSGAKRIGGAKKLLVDKISSSQCYSHNTPLHNVSGIAVDTLLVG